MPCVSKRYLRPRIPVRGLGLSLTRACRPAVFFSRVKKSSYLGKTNLATGPWGGLISHESSSPPVLSSTALGAPSYLPRTHMLSLCHAARQSQDHTLDVNKPASDLAPEAVPPPQNKPSDAGRSISSAGSHRTPGPTNEIALQDVQVFAETPTDDAPPRRDGACRREVQGRY